MYLSRTVFSAGRDPSEGMVACLLLEPNCQTIQYLKILMHLHAEK